MIKSHRDNFFYYRQRKLLGANFFSRYLLIAYPLVGGLIVRAQDNFDDAGFCEFYAFDLRPVSKG